MASGHEVEDRGTDSAESVDYPPISPGWRRRSWRARPSGASCLCADRAWATRSSRTRSTAAAANAQRPLRGRDQPPPQRRERAVDRGPGSRARTGRGDPRASGSRRSSRAGATSGASTSSPRSSAASCPERLAVSSAIRGAPRSQRSWRRSPPAASSGSRTAMRTRRRPRPRAQRPPTSGRDRRVLTAIDAGAPALRGGWRYLPESRGSLPDRPLGYYREYTVATPGSPDRGRASPRDRRGWRDLLHGRPLRIVPEEIAR